MLPEHRGHGPDLFVDVGVSCRLRSPCRLPVSMLVGAGAGVELQTLLMATSMSVGMAALMVWHRSPVSSIVEMCLAMYLSFAVLLPAHWLGVLSGEAVIGLGHVVMLPIMAAVMLHRREPYLDHH
jgi:hypothetical protein